MSIFKDISGDENSNATVVNVSTGNGFISRWVNAFLTLS